jgi:RHS repeat-associated protein
LKRVRQVPNSGYQYKYNGKEWQDELGLNMYDYVARNYDPALGRWMNVDPLAPKYYESSPYNYTANNPVVFVDFDGRDYGITFDFKNGTVTVSATYFALSNDMAEAKNSVSFWNNQSGSYTYSYRDENGNVHTLDVIFDLQVQEVIPQSGQSDDLALQIALNQGPSGESNIFKVVPNGTLGTDKNGDVKNGITSEGNRIYIDKSRVGTETGGHEVGHTLGIVRHSNYGIMTASQKDPKRSQNPTKDNINTIVYYPIKSNSDNPTKARESKIAGQATIFFKNNTESNSPQNRKAFRKFRNGKIKN